MNLPYDLCWDAKATKLLRKYFNYYKKNASLAVAERFQQAITDAVETLLEHPERYPSEKLLAHLPQNYRSIPVWNFKIVYEFTGMELIIVFIYHQKQHPDNIRKSFER